MYIRLNECPINQSIELLSIVSIELSRHMVNGKYALKKRVFGVLKAIVFCCIYR